MLQRTVDFTNYVNYKITKCAQYGTGQRSHFWSSWHWTRSESRLNYLANSKIRKGAHYGTDHELTNTKNFSLTSKERSYSSERSLQSGTLTHFGALNTINASSGLTPLIRGLLFWGTHQVQMASACTLALQRRQVDASSSCMWTGECASITCTPQHCNL